MAYNDEGALSPDQPVRTAGVDHSIAAVDVPEPTPDRQPSDAAVEAAAPLMSVIKRLILRWMCGPKPFPGPESHYGLSDDAWQEHLNSEGPR